MTVLQQAKKAASRVAPDPLLRTYRLLRQNPMQRRDELDMDHLRLLMRFWLAPDANCIDIGANTGDVLADIIAICPRGQHYAFEPLAEHVAHLRATYPGVRVHQTALSDAAGTATFTHVLNEGASGYSGFRPQWYPTPMDTEELRVDTARLDDVLPADYRPHLIKIDVEGAERDVISGAMGTIRRHRPVVVFEHFEGGAGEGYGYGPEVMHELLVDRAGLRIYDIDGHGPYSAEQMREVFDSRRLWTWIARP